MTIYIYIYIYILPLLLCSCDKPRRPPCLQRVGASSGLDLHVAELGRGASRVVVKQGITMVDEPRGKLLAVAVHFGQDLLYVGVGIQPVLIRLPLAALT